MKEKINFNVIEKNKTQNTKDVEKTIKTIINKLIERQFISIAR